MGNRHKDWSFHKKLVWTLSMTALGGFSIAYGVVAHDTGTEASPNAPLVTSVSPPFSSPTPTKINKTPKKVEKSTTSAPAKVKRTPAPSAPAPVVGTSPATKPTPAASRSGTTSPKPSASSKPRTTAPSPTSKPTQPTQPPVKPNPTYGSGMTQYEVDVLGLTNVDHKKYCGSPMVSDTALNSYARAWSANMKAKNVLYHSNLSFSGNFRGENVASGYNDPDLVMRGWRNSIDHYKNIINCSYTRLGIGYVSGYWTQVFSGN